MSKVLVMVYKLLQDHTPPGHCAPYIYINQLQAFVQHMQHYHWHTASLLTSSLGESVHLCWNTVLDLRASTIS